MWAKPMMKQRYIMNAPLASTKLSSRGTTRLRRTGRWAMAAVAEIDAGQSAPDDRGQAEQDHQPEDFRRRARAWPGGGPKGRAEEEKAIARVADQQGEEEGKEGQEPEADVDLGVSGQRSHELEERLDGPHPPRIAEQSGNLGRIVGIGGQEAPALGLGQGFYPGGGLGGTEAFQIGDIFFSSPVRPERGRTPRFDEAGVA